MLFTPYGSGNGNGKSLGSQKANGTESTLGYFEYGELLE
jgi:hypothetical protein